MDCYSPKPQKEYTVQLTNGKPKSFKKFSLGLGDADAVDSPELWNLLSVTSKLMFQWENPRIKMGDRPASFPQLYEARCDLEEKVYGVKIKILTRTHDVDEFCNLMIAEDLSHLALCRFFDNDQDALKMIVKARQAVCKKARGDKLTKREKAIIAMVKKRI